MPFGRARTLPTLSESGQSFTGRFEPPGGLLRPVAAARFADRLGERLDAIPATRRVLEGLLDMSGSDEPPVRDPDPDKAADHEEHDR